MKCLAIFLAYLSFACLISMFSCEKNWIQSNIVFRNFNLKVISHYKIDPSNISNLISLIDKSCDSKNPKELKANEYNGIIRKNDIIVVTKKLLLWFSATTKSDGRIAKSGGGLLSGSWELKFNKNTRKVFFKFSKSFFANFLLPCSTPKNIDYGSRIYGGYPASKIKWTLEASDKISLGSKFGKDILEIGKGPYSANEGLYLEFKGVVTNTGIESGFESITDTDPRPGVEGLTEFVLSYRIPASKNEIIQEIEFNTITNNFGPITTPIIEVKVPLISNNLNKNSTDISYAANPELIPREKDIDLKNVEINKYFRNTCVKKVFFYEMHSEIDENINESKKNLKTFGNERRKKSDYYTRTVSTPLGRGKILCLGNPNKKMSFLCAYPNNDYIPKEYYDEYSLSVINNQRQKNNRFFSLRYKLSAIKNKTMTFERGQKLILIMRYKFIDASSAVRN